MNKPPLPGGRWRWLALLLLSVGLAGCKESAPAPDAQALLSAPASGFTQAAVGDRIRLPQDLGPHRDFRLEWWYLTANLRSASGEPWGVQWTLFRLGRRPFAAAVPPPGWYRDEFWLAHAAVSAPGQHRLASKWARGGSGQADVQLAPFRAWIDQWQLRAQPEAAGFRLEVDSPAFAYQLQLQPRLPPVRHGKQGFSAKSSEGGGSMYFSYPALAVSGQLQVDGRRIEVQGQGWFDREWSSQYLLPQQQGWDWFALHLEDGRHLMLFRIRGREPFLTGTLVQADGSSRTLEADRLRLEPLRYRASALGEVPVLWRFSLPDAGLQLEIESWPGDFSNSGPLAYWEGPVQVRGSHSGEGYLEMTGYNAD